MKINCIVCATEIENWDIAYPEKEVVHPIGGTMFRTYGHYGSSVFDPMDASYMEIVVCDECLNSRLAHTYEGVNSEYRAEMDAIVAQMDLTDLEKNKTIEPAVIPRQKPSYL